MTAPTPAERTVLRRLATAVRDIALHPGMAARRHRLAEHGALRGDRPVVLVSPEGAWDELVPPASLVCRDPLLRGWELQLRRKIHWWNRLRDDGALEPWLDVAVRHHLGDWGVPITYRHGADRGSYHWEPPLRDLDGDLRRLHPRTMVIDHQATRADLDLAQELVGDLLPPRTQADYFWTMGLTWDAITLYGLERFLVALAEDPDGVERLLAFLRDDLLGILDQIDAQRGWTPNARSGQVCSGGSGLCADLPADGAAGTRQRWGFAESQETVGVSPRMFAAHVLPYQVPLLERFGLNGYGCCEAVHQRLDAILGRVPRLRRLSVSPWSDQEACAERLGKGIIFSRKPNPAPVCVGFQEDAIRTDLARTARLAATAHIELVLKDTHTVEHQPWRIRRWIELAYQAIGVDPEPLDDLVADADG